MLSKFTSYINYKRKENKYYSDYKFYKNTKNGRLQQISLRDAYPLNDCDVHLPRKWCEDESE